jgi:hypothetical protein
VSHRLSEGGSTRPIYPTAHPRRGAMRADDKRQQVRELYAEHQRGLRPDLRTFEDYARAAGCSRKLVASVLPPLKQPKGERVTIPRDLATWAESRGGVVAVLERARAADRDPGQAIFQGEAETI